MIRQMSITLNMEKCNDHKRQNRKLEIGNTTIWQQDSFKTEEIKLKFNYKH